MSDEVEVLWWGKVNGDAYRVVRYGGGTMAVECRWAEGGWHGVSYGDHADSPEVATVAAHLATALRDLQAAAREYRVKARRLVDLAACAPAVAPGAASTVMRRAIDAADDEWEAADAALATLLPVAEGAKEEVP